MKVNIIIVLGLLVLIFSGCSNRDNAYFTGDNFGIEDDEDNEAVVIEIKDYKFIPQNITINKETSVIWINKDNVSHTVTSTLYLADSGIIKPGDRVKYEFEEEGEYHYYCLIHPEMRGVVIVVDENKREED